MRYSASRWAILGAFFCFLAVESTAEAAKGVKKASLAKGQQMLSGVIVSLSADGNGGGSFQLRTAIPHKKNGSANAPGTVTDVGPQSAKQNGGQSVNQGPKQYTVLTFNVSDATQFQYQPGAADGAGLTVGAHVRVLATENQAQGVQILSRSSSMTRLYMRYRMRAYYPHIHYHTVQ